MKKRVLVVGARPNSLGEAVANVASRRGYQVVTAGISGEDVRLNLLSSVTEIEVLRGILQGIDPHHVVCTVGINQPEAHEDADVSWWMRAHFEANVIAPLRLLDAWMPVASMGHYVAVSSNSARIPRTRSMAYCASKAALSMALRVRARELGGAPVVYGYEPGLLLGTPMTEKTAAGFTGPLTRMKVPELARGIVVDDLAELMVQNLGHPGLALNGTLVPYDADEL